MSVPLRIRFDWDRIRICESCGERLAKALLESARSGVANIDIVKIICDDCWKYNVDNGGIIAEIDPKVVRK